MIKFFMRKTIFKDFDKESQDRLLKLTLKWYIIEFLCLMFWAVIYILPVIPLYIINICEDIEFSMTTQIALLVFMSVSFITFLIFYIVFKKTMFVFSLLLAERVYFLVCTMKGNALNKSDIKFIKQVNEKLYECISTQRCQGYCYSICFDICKTLKKGEIEFLAVKKCFPYDEEEDDGKVFTMHVLYVNNGWAFDLTNSCQYPIDKLHEIYKAKIYKRFSFDEISSKSYEEFREEQVNELEKWSNENDCSMFWKENKKDT